MLKRNKKWNHMIDIILHQYCKFEFWKEISIIIWYHCWKEIKWNMEGGDKSYEYDFNK